MRTEYLMTPGPTVVPERILLAMAGPIIHHRTPAFADIVAEVREGLKYLFQTEQEVLTFASSGTGAMDAAVSNLLSPGDRAICVRGGKFGERWAEICAAYGIEPVNIDVEWGRAVDPDAVEAILNEDKSIKAVFAQATETSTGVLHPVKELAEVVRGRDALIIIDGITAVGVIDIPMDEWGLDGLITGSQKALMLPPGLGMLALSERAYRAAESSRRPKYYFNVIEERKKLEKNSTLFTPAVSLIVGLREALAMIKEEGKEKVFARHERLSKATRAAVKALGFRMFAAPPSPALTAVDCAPLDGQSVVKLMRDEMGVTIAGGQDRAKGKIFRISHMGHTDEWRHVLTIAALERALDKLGHEFAAGAGVTALTEALK